MDISISCQYKERNIQALARKIKNAASILLEELGLSHCQLSILLTDDSHMKDLNQHYRKKDKATNVLSFPFLSEGEDSKEYIVKNHLGDIVISIDTAKREAKEYKQPLDLRIYWLLTHGLLHLTGLDHERSSEEALKMQGLEKDLLSKIKLKRSLIMPKLAINVDHIATVRQARGVAEPDPVTAAAICELAGASGIVVHLREDRRHIQDKDVYLLRKTVKTKLNLEMGANKDIIDIALDVVPDLVTLVPEKRQELTTEGGLDVLSQKKKLTKVIKKFNKENIPVSLFIDPDPYQIEASQDVGATYVEIHTGRYCDAKTEEEIEEEYTLIESAAEEAYHRGLIVNGGHGLDYQNCGRIAAIETFDELSIGHAIISRSVFSGLESAVKDMLKIMRNAQLQLV